MVDLVICDLTLSFHTQCRQLSLLLLKTTLFNLITYAICNFKIAKGVENDVIRIEVHNCHDETLVTQSDVNQTSVQFLKFPTSFDVGRNYGETVTSSGKQCYKWKIYLTNPMAIPYINIDFGTIKMQGENDTIQTFVHVNEYRKCEQQKYLAESTHDPSTNLNYTLQAFYYYCDLINPEDSKLEAKNKSTSITITTVTSTPQNVSLATMFFGEQQGTNDKIECGDPETVHHAVLGQASDTGNQEFKFQCNSSFADYLGKSRKYWYSFKCNANGLWEGIYPQCVPKRYCSELEELQNEIENNVEIESISNVFFFNESQYFSVEWSRVTYRCVNFESILVGRSNSRICLNGTWTARPPRCTNPGVDKILTSQSGSPWIILASLIFLLIFIIGLVWCITWTYMSRIKRQLATTASDQISANVDARFRAKHQSIYDDCMETFDDPINSNNYETVAFDAQCGYEAVNLGPNFENYYCVPNNAGNTGYVCYNNYSPEPKRKLEPNYLEMLPGSTEKLKNIH